MTSLRELANVVDRRREIERAQRELEDIADNPNPFNPLAMN